MNKNNNNWLPTDEDTNLFFRDIAKLLVDELKISLSEAESYIEDYYSKFTDKKYCDAISIPVQDDDFFFHEAAGGMALRIIYYLVQENDPDPKSFIEWRSNL